MEWMIEFPCGEDVPGPASAGSFFPVTSDVIAFFNLPSSSKFDSIH